MYRCDKLHVEFCSRNRHVETSLSAHSVDRSEIVRHLAVLILAVCDAEYDSVSLIALHRFEIFDKKLLLLIGCKKFFFGRVGKPSLGNEVFYQILLGYAERHDAQTSVGIFVYIVKHQVDDIFRLRPVGAAFVVKSTAVYVVVIHSYACGVNFRRREGHKVAVIELLVGKIYKAFVSAAVVPF